MLNILFVLYDNFFSNSAIHVHYLANNLVDLGFDCVVTIPGDKNTISALSDHLYKIANFREIDNLKSLFNNQEKPDIVHVWTPREVVRQYYERLKEKYNFKLVIHLEDNEECILERFLKKTLVNCLNENDILVPEGLSHPKKYRDFLAKADGVTIIIDQLKKFVPSKTPTVTLWPGVDTKLFFPRKSDPTLAASLGVPLGSIVICYTGNAHPANAHEVRSIYLAVAMMNRKLRPTILIRTGRDYCDFLGSDDKWAKKYSLELGFVERAKLPDILALADVLVQPGQGDDFNNYRFPSKLPDFLAMGKPVILPKSNIGCFMEHGKDALVLPRVDALSIFDYVNLLLKDQELYHRLSNNASYYAKNNLDWDKTTKQLKSFYETIHASNSQLKTALKIDSKPKRQIELEPLYLYKRQTQIELEEAHFQLQQTQIALEQAYFQLQQTQVAVEYAKERIKAIESSKFWKIRMIWLRLKQLVGLKVDE